MSDEFKTVTDHKYIDQNCHDNGCQHLVLQERISELEAENKRLQAWVNDLHKGVYINCVYCGHRYGPEAEVQATMAQVLKDHIEQCPQHPLSAAKQRIAELETTLARFEFSNPELGDLSFREQLRSQLITNVLERITRLEAALTEIAQTSKGYPNGSREGKIARKALVGKE